MDAQKREAVMLPEWFQKAGYDTAAFVNNSVAGKNITGRGFDLYDEGQLRPPSITERRGLANPEYQAPAATDRILRWLDSPHQKPFFLFALYWEPHSPYNPPPEHDIFKSSAYPDVTNTGWDVLSGRLFRWADLGDSKAIERMTQLYDGKIHFVDLYVGKLLDKLRSTGLGGNTVVMLTSDHGELLYSHPEDYLTFDHRSLYDQVMHVPGILWGAKVPHGKTVAAMAHHIDIAPTLLAFAGLPAKPDAQGTNLLPAAEGKMERIHEYVFGEQDILEPLRSVRDSRFKLILNERTGRKQLFDDRADPGEFTDIAVRKPEVAKNLADALERWRKDNEPPASERDARWRAAVGQSPPETIIDEVTTGAHLQLTGAGWHQADQESNFKGGCFWTEPAQADETPRTASWRVDNPMIGSYRVSIWFGGLPEGKISSNTIFTVHSQDGSRSFTVDQTKPTGGWRVLATIKDPISVNLTNRANGRVIVDAVKFERL
jgi:arylsulfatase A-like enzyme